ncbi:MAG: hypothetical protein HXX16_20755 [Bacteroidales bacterium]|nr:hypothetical protein [Bacteroidales bacterium]
MNLILILLGITFVILGNLLINYLIVNKALKKLILPELHNHGYDFVKIKSTGFLNSGDFKDSLFQLRPFNPAGNYKITLYRFVYFQGKSKKDRKVTVKIRWNLFCKTKIEFKPGL